MPRRSNIALGKSFNALARVDRADQSGYVRSMFSIRGILAVGFAIVFGLWVLSAYELVRSLRTVQARTAAEHEAAFQGERLLSTIRANVLLGSIYLRDAIIDNRSLNVEAYRRELDQIQEEVERLLPAYVVEVTSPEERQHWEQLQERLNEYWKSREVGFSVGAPLNAAEAASLLRSRVVPSRTTVLQILDRLLELQGMSQRRHEGEVSALYAQLQNRLLLIGALAIVVGLIVAGIATRQVGHLERQIEEQRAGERQTREDLERLSARLVTVQEEERRSLARELHDEVGQALTAIKMDVAVALRGVEALRGSEPAAKIASALDDARSITENSLQNVRDLSHLLHPPTLDDFGLPEAVRSYLRTFSKRTGISAQLTQLGMERRLRPQVEVCVYRIVQEAMTNVARHSGARSATVNLLQTEEGLRVTIEDDGRGIARPVQRSGAASVRGVGVIAMRERAQALGGTFAIEQMGDHGTRVIVHLPVATTPSDLSDLSQKSREELLAG